MNRAKKIATVTTPVHLELAGQGKDPTRIQLAIVPNPQAEIEITLPGDAELSEDEIVSQIDRSYQRFDEAYTTARTADKAALQFAREHGAWLLEAKKLTKHGEWGKWVDEFCKNRGRAARTIRLHMQIAKEWEQICKLATVANLNVLEMGVKDAVTLLGMDRRNFRQLPVRQEDALVELEEAQELVAPWWEVKRLSDGSLQVNCKIPDRAKSFNFSGLQALELAWNTHLKDATEASLAASQAIAAERNCMNCEKWCERYHTSVGKNEVWCGFLRTAIAVTRVAEMPEICGQWSDGKPEWVVDTPAVAPVEEIEPSVEVEVLQQSDEPVAVMPPAAEPPIEFPRPIPRPVRKALWKPIQPYDRKTAREEAGLEDEMPEVEVQIVNVQICYTMPDGKPRYRAVPLDELDLVLGISN